MEMAPKYSETILRLIYVLSEGYYNSMPAVTQNVFEIIIPQKRNIRKVHIFCIFLSDECGTSIPLWPFKLRASLFLIIRYEFRNTYNVCTRVTSPYYLILSGKNRLLHYSLILSGKNRLLHYSLILSGKNKLLHYSLILSGKNKLLHYSLILSGKNRLLHYLKRRFMWGFEER
jgi:hypothetical protein